MALRSSYNKEDISLPGPAIIAAGATTPDLTDYGYSRKKKGVTGRFHSSKKLLPVVLCFDDFAIVPHAGLHSFNAGGLSLDRPDSDEVEPDEMLAILRRTEQLGKLAIGPWKGLPPDIFDNPPDFRAGQRDVGLCPTIRQSADNPNLVLAFASASAGISLAPFIGRAAAGFIALIARTITSAFVARIF